MLFAQQPPISEITVHHTDGTSFTLNAGAREVRVSTGIVIKLSPEQTAEIATAFRATTIGDPLAGEIDRTPPPPSGCGPESGGVCESALPSIDGPSVLVRQVSKSAKTKPGKTFGLGPLSYTKPRSKPSSTESSNIGIASTSDYGWPPSCLDMAREMFAMTPRYRATRNSVLNTLKEIASTTFELDDYGRPTVRLPNLPTLAYTLMNQMADESDAFIQMQYWAGMYTGYGCTANNWPDAGGGGGGGGLTLECHNEGWEISYDGGRTWHPIEVSVCQYVMM